MTICVWPLQASKIVCNNFALHSHKIVVHVNRIFFFTWMSSLSLWSVRVQETQEEREKKNQFTEYMNDECKVEKFLAYMIFYFFFLLLDKTILWMWSIKVDTPRIEEKKEVTTWDCIIALCSNELRKDDEASRKMRKKNCKASINLSNVCDVCDPWSNDSFYIFLYVIDCEVGCYFLFHSNVRHGVT